MEEASEGNTEKVEKNTVKEMDWSVEALDWASHKGFPRFINIVLTRISKKELANKLNVSMSTIRRWLNGSSSPLRYLERDKVVEKCINLILLDMEGQMHQPD